MIRMDSSDDEILRFLACVKGEAPRNALIAADLAAALAASGDVYHPGTELTADVASTGGPSSLSTLLCQLFLRAGGLAVPKLGVPGRPAGGIDCLAQIEGYRTELDGCSLDAVMRTVGYAHFTAGGRYAPLDERVFLLRQKHGCQNVPTLVAASLLSKKLAVGVTNAGLDIRVASHGNFGGTMSQARQNAKLFAQAAALLGLRGHAALTDGSTPYQPYIGRGEALLALSEVFDGASEEWLDVHLEQCRMLSSTASPAAHRPAVEAASRAELRHWFFANLQAQGAEEGAFSKKVAQVREGHINQILARQDGIVEVSLEKIRRSLLKAQGAAAREGVPFPDPAGIVLRHKPGTLVCSGEALATVRVNEVSLRDTLLSELSVAISASPVAGGQKERTI